MTSEVVFPKDFTEKMNVEPIYVPAGHYTRWQLFCICMGYATVKEKDPPWTQPVAGPVLSQVLIDEAAKLFDDGDGDRDLLIAGNKALSEEKKPEVSQYTTPSGVQILHLPPPKTVKAGEEIVPGAVAQKAPVDDDDTLPWSTEDDLNKKAPPRPSTPLTPAPRGVPSIKHVREVLTWIRGNKATHEAFLDCLFTDKGNIKKNLGELSECVGKMPVHDTARWMFHLMPKFVKIKALHEAYAEINPNAFDSQMEAWGFRHDGVLDGSEAWKAMAANPRIMHIFNEVIEDGGSNGMLMGSVKDAMDALKNINGKLDEKAKEKMVAKLEGLKVSTGSPELLKPLRVMMTSLGALAEFSALQTAIFEGRVKVDDLQQVFKGKYLPLYNSLSSCFSHGHVKPDWLTGEQDAE